MYYPCGVITHDIKIKIKKKSPAKMRSFLWVVIFIFKNQVSLSDFHFVNLSAKTWHHAQITTNLGDDVYYTKDDDKINHKLTTKGSVSAIGVFLAVSLGK